MMFSTSILFVYAPKAMWWTRANDEKFRIIWYFVSKTYQINVLNLIVCVANSTKTKCCSHATLILYTRFVDSRIGERWCLRFSKCAWKSLMSVNILFSCFLLAILSRMCEYWILVRYMYMKANTWRSYINTHTTHTLIFATSTNHMTWDGVERRENSILRNTPNQI